MTFKGTRITTGKNFWWRSDIRKRTMTSTEALYKWCWRIQKYTSWNRRLSLTLKLTNGRCRILLSNKKRWPSRISRLQRIWWKMKRTNEILLWTTVKSLKVHLNPVLRINQRWMIVAQWQVNSEENKLQKNSQRTQQKIAAMPCTSNNKTVLNQWMMKGILLHFNRQDQATRVSWTGGKIKTMVQAWRFHHMMRIIKVAQQAHLNDNSQWRKSKVSVAKI